MESSLGKYLCVGVQNTFFYNFEQLSVTPSDMWYNGVGKPNLFLGFSQDLGNNNVYLLYSDVIIAKKLLGNNECQLRCSQMLIYIVGIFGGATLESNSRRPRTYL